jgi:hypothetical protein
MPEVIHQPRNRPQCQKCLSYDFFIDQSKPDAPISQFYIRVRCVECGEIVRDDRVRKMLEEF